MGDTNKFQRGSFKFGNLHRCFFLGEIGAEFLHGEVIIDPDGAVLAEKFREFGAVGRKGFVGGEYLERLSENQLLDESCLDSGVGSLHHPGEFIPFGVVETHFDAVVASVGKRRSSAFVELCHIIYVD